MAPSPIAASADPRAAPLTLAQRLAAIRDECFGIGKTDIKMGNFSIKAHTVEAVLAEVRPLFAKHGVLFIPTLESRTDAGNRCDIVVAFEFERLDDPNDRRTIKWAGSGTDNSDKAFAKAGTNALKEMLKKVFLITDRDDAKEEEDRTEHRAEGGASRDEVDQAKERARSAIEKWASSFKAALDTASTEKEVERLRAENMDQLNDETLPPVTRQFFFDHIQRRKTEIKAR